MTDKERITKLEEQVTVLMGAHTNIGAPYKVSDESMTKLNLLAGSVSSKNQLTPEEISVLEEVPLKDRMAVATNFTSKIILCLLGKDVNSDVKCAVANNSNTDPMCLYFLKGGE